MSYYLFLDDERMPRDVKWVLLPQADWVIVRNHDEFCNYIKENGVPEFVSFDHDLADFHYHVMQQEVCDSFTIDDGDLKKTYDYGPEKTGYDSAKWLVEHCHLDKICFPNYLVHSLNPIGAQRIKEYIDSALANDYIKMANY